MFPGHAWRIDFCFSKTTAITFGSEQIDVPQDVDLSVSLHPGFLRNRSNWVYQGQTYRTFGHEEQGYVHLKARFFSVERHDPSTSGRVNR